MHFALNCYAKEITVLYTGDTNAMLYPCNCPVEPDGGIARRAALVRQLRKENPNTLLLDSGGFFAGGITDEYSQSVELNKKRTLVDLKAMKLMGYDAVGISEDEFNFGREFLEENAVKEKVTLLSCNLKSSKLTPYIIKEVAGTKIGVIAAANPNIKPKTAGLEFIEPVIAVKQTVDELKKKGASIIVLLSRLNEDEELRLINETAGIDIIITGFMHSGGVAEKKGPTLILKPFRQGRRLGKLTLRIGDLDNKITDYKADELRLSDKISDDPAILSFLPRCFRDADCKKKGSSAKCEEGGSIKAHCVFNEVPKVNLSIITSKECLACYPENVIKQFESTIPGLSASFLYYPEARASKLVNDLGITALPAYIFGKEIEKDKSFEGLKERLEPKKEFYLLKPQFSGIAYLLERKNTKGSLDLFISLYDKDSAAILDAIEGFRPNVHFLAVEQQNGFDAGKGTLEVEEYLRCVCVQKYYPERFFSYLRCRSKNINTSWWEDCLGGLDTSKIKTCAKGEEGRGLLRANIQLNKDLELIVGPIYLLDNQQLFGTEGIPSKEEFKRLFKR